MPGQRKITEEQKARLVEISALRAEGLSWESIGNQFGVSKSAIWTFVRRHKFNLTLGKKPHTIKQITRLQKIAEARGDGQSWDAIAKSEGVTKTAVWYFVKLHKPELLKEKILPDRIANRLQMIIAMRSEGHSFETIATKQNVTSASLRSFISRHKSELLIDYNKNNKRDREMQIVMDLKKEGLTTKKIANRLGISEHKVTRYIRRARSLATLPSKIKQ